MAEPKIKYDIEANVKGEAEAAALATEIKGLGDALENNLKTEAEDAANALRKLVEQSKASTSFQEVGKAALQAGAAFKEQEAALRALEQRLVEAQAATGRFAAAETTAREDVRASAAALDAAKVALAKLDAGYDSAGRNTAEYATQAGALKVQIAELGAGLRAKREALQDATADTRQAAREEDALARESQKLGTEVGRLRTAYAEANRALEESRDKLKAAGVDAGNFANEQRRLVTETDNARQAVTGYTATFKALAEGERIAREVREAMQTLGTQSFDHVQREIAKVNQALETVKAASRNPLEIKAATEAAQRKIQELETGMRQTERSAISLGDTLGKLGPVMAAAFSGREMLGAMIQAEALQRGLTAVTGSAESAGKEMAFLKNTANALGLEVQSAGQSYLSLTAATKGTQLEGEKTREIFTAISRAMSALGKSSADTDRALTAVAQMASKGTVSMEELRGQLGEALPGAMQAAATGAGLTVAQLVAMVSTGEVLAKDLLPALVKGLDDLYAKGPPPDGLIAQWNRFRNVVTETSEAVGEGGVGKALSWLSGAGATAVTGFSAAVGFMGDAIGQTAGYIATGNKEVHTLEESLAQAVDQINRVKVAAGLADPEVESLGNAAESAGKKAVDGLGQVEQAGKAAGAGALAAKQAFIEQEAAASRLLLQSTKGVAAADAEAKAVTALASAFGTETEKLEAAALASNLKLQAQQRLTAARQEDLSVAQRKLEAFDKETAGMAVLSQELSDQRKKLEDSVKLKTEEARASGEQAKAYEVLAAQARLASETHKDNAQRVGELRGALNQANAELERTRELHRQGKASGDELRAAVLAQAQAWGLYRDALNDATAAAQRQEAQAARVAVTRQKELELNVETARTQLALAQARGDETAAMGAQQRLREAETAARWQAVQTMQAEAQGMRGTADAMEREARATGTLTAEKKEQIAALRESARQKELDAQKTDLLATREAALARTVQSGADTIVDALERRNAAQERLNATLEKADELERKRRGVDKEGFSTNTAGERVSMAVPTARYVYETAKSQGLDEKMALELADRFIHNGQPTGTRESGMDWFSTVNEAVSEAVMQQARAAVTQAPAAPGGGGAASGNTGGITRVVNFQVNGGAPRSIPTTVQGEASARELAKDFLRALEQERGTSA